MRRPRVFSNDGNHNKKGAPWRSPFEASKLYSVLRDLRIHSIRPSCYTASEVVDFVKARLLQERYRFRTATTHLAVDDDFAAGVEFVHPFRQIV